ERLREEGLMPPAGSLVGGIPRLKSGNENGGDGECTFIESLAAIAVGTEIFINGVKYVVEQSIYSAARALWMVTACLLLQGDTSHRQFCNLKFQSCYSPIPDGCSICLQYCLTQGGVWPPVSTHQCY